MKKVFVIMVVLGCLGCMPPRAEEATTLIINTKNEMVCLVDACANMYALNCEEVTQGIPDYSCPQVIREVSRILEMNPCCLATIKDCNIYQCQDI